MKRERVCETQGRHVEENVKKKRQDEELAGVSERRRREHRQPAEDVQNAKNALGGKETIRHHADEKGRHDGSDGTHRIGPVNDVGQVDDAGS